MPRNEVVPIAQMDRRAPEAGRIRIGKKIPNTAKGARSKDRPSSIGTFRFTSLHRDLIELIAAKHGGTVSEWDDADAKYRHQWQVETTASQIPVYLPRNGLSQDLELWVHGGRQRQCDGEIVETVKIGPDGTEFTQSPCICAAKGVRECQLKTRISVVIPDIPFLGVWRLDTGSWNAGHELPGMFEMVTALQTAIEGSTRPLVSCLLGVEQRTDRVDGKTRHYVVPTLGVAVTPLEIQAGLVDVQAIGPGAIGELGTGQPTPAKTERPVLELQERNGHTLPTSPPPYGGDAEQAPTDADDDIVDGEIVDPDEKRPDMHDAMLRTYALHYKLDEDKFVAAVRAMPAPVEKVLEDLASGFVVPTGFSGTGTIKWKQNTGG